MTMIPTTADRLTVSDTSPSHDQTPPPRAGLAAKVAAGALGLAMLPLSGALAQTPRPPAEITITNARTAALTMLEVATTGSAPRLVGKLPRALAPGQSVKLRLTRPAGCTYFVLARFADDVESESEGFDLCADRTIRLVD